MAPVLYIGLLTQLPMSIIRAKHLMEDVVVEHPMEFGRNYSNPAVWATAGRGLEDYLFEEPRARELAGGVPGAPPLWTQLGAVPAGACFCRTLGLVGPGAEGLKAFFERRYAAWRRSRGFQGLSPIDAALRERDCPAKNQATLFRIFDSEETVKPWFDDITYGGVNRSRDTGFSGMDRLCGLVVFENDPHNSTVPRCVVRTNITGFGVAGAGGRAAAKAVNREAHSLKEQSGPYAWYFASGFLSIQSLVEEYLLQERLGAKYAEHREVDFVPLPTDNYAENVFLKVLSGPVANTPVTPTIMFASNVMLISSFMIRERNLRQKELMRLMGLYDSALTLSWLALFAVANFLAALGCSVLIYANLVQNSSLLPMFLFTFLCAMGTTAMGMVISTLISTERLGALVAFGVYDILGLAYFSLTAQSQGSSVGMGGLANGQEVSDTVSARQLYLVSLLPHVAFTLCLKTYLGMDRTPQGSSLRSMFTPFKKYTLAGGITMLILDFFLYGLLYLYLEQVVQHDIGLARRWNFPLDPAFWRELFGLPGPAPAGGQPAAAPREAEHEAGKIDDDLFEAEDSAHLEQLRRKHCVVSVKGLRKEFHNASGATVRAVDGLTLTMYQGECFCLLGHNGAGKSTTMAILTGMLPQDDGEVEVYGHRLPEERDQVRRQMGFCMQHNVLWETLSVEEHVFLFGALMGLSPAAVRDSCDEVLQKVELTSKRHAEATSLSGGMKRKLNVALALLGSARILFLDEPTAGMDPHTRRQLWEVLKESRNERIVCLTTHYMDEADELGDRVCIMVSGRAACSGTNAFLKHKLGCGYMLNFVKATEAAKDGPILALARKHCGHEVAEASVVGRELRLRVPFASAKGFPSLMQELDRKLPALGLESYGVGVSDLEDVFLKVASGHDVRPGAAATLSRQVSGAVDEAAHSGGDPAAATAGAGKAALEWRRPQPTFGRQLVGLLQRRVRYGRRDSRMFCCQLLVPIIVIALFLGITTSAIRSNLALSFPVVSLDTARWNPDEPDGFGPTLVSVGAVGPAGAKSVQAWRRTPPPGVTQVITNTSVLPSGSPKGRRGQLLAEEAFARFAADAAHDPAAGASTPQFGGVLYTDERVIILPNNSAQYSAPALLALHYDAVIAAAVEDGAASVAGEPLRGIEVSSQPLDATISERAMVDMFSGFAMGLSIITAYAFIPAGIAAFVAMEKELEVQHQMRVSGVSRAAYWLSNFIFDTAFGVVSCMGTLGVIALFGSSQWLSYPTSHGTITLLLLFPPAAATFAYFWSFFFSTSGSTLVAVLMLGLTVGAFGLQICNALIFFPKTRAVGYVLAWTTRALVPSACVGNGLLQLATFKDLIVGLHLNVFAGFVFGTEYTFAFMGDGPSISIAGDDAFMLAVDTVVYAVLLVFVDAYGDRCLLSRLRHGREVRCPEPLLQAEDPNVAAERERVQKLDHASQVLVVDGVHKTYDGGATWAVRGISYAVEAGQVFGLLGVNGAGKTTTFKMLCGQLEPSAGRILVGGRDVAREPGAVQQLIGYCPQFNALLDLLTVREHLELFGQIKGLAGPELEADIEDKIRTFDLSRFEHSRAAQLSGGNMRKLSCALAMVGEPPIIFLDEPSAGMDPVARRFMWDVIQGIAQRRQGSAVILTTHSMEEADALCSRIAIQAAGHLRCLGTPQQLKERYGAGLELNVRLEVPAKRAVDALCAEWGGTAADMRPMDAASRLAEGRLRRQGSHAPAPYGGGQGDTASLGALAEWCLTQEQAEGTLAFLRDRCGAGTVECLERSGRSLSYRLQGGCPGGGPLPYGELFRLLQDNCARLHFADFQLSQGTLERTFNRLASEDLARSREAEG